MPKLIINGGKQLCGELTVQGAKNSVLPLLAATILCKGISVFHNCPRLSDVAAAMNILKHLGCSCLFDDSSIKVDANNFKCSRIPDKLMLKMRSSVIFLGAILGRCGFATISSPGGCELGPRPIDLHISSLKKLGVTTNEKHGIIEFYAPNGLIGNEINLSFASVGATENIILAAVTAKGRTIIYNAAKEPEICDLCEFLNESGARIFGGGTDTVIIDGVDSLSGCEHNVIPDRIVATTFMAAAAITGGDIVLNNINPTHITAICSAFEESGCEISIFDNKLRLKSPKRLLRISTIRTSIYPGFPTDAGPIILSMLTLSKGSTIIVENIFENRFRYVDELKRLGANISVEGRVAIIEGTTKLSAAYCRCTDLRGGAALVIAGLAAKGTTVVDDIFHIKRGYEKLDYNLSLLGADIKEI